MDLGLKDKIVIVTGGAKGIGRAIVKTFAEEGAIPVIINRSSEKGIELSAQLKKAGMKSHFIKGDVTDPDLCRASVENTIKEFGRIDHLINNVGVNDRVGADAGPEKFLESLKLNLVSSYSMMHFALPHLKRSKGSIVNIGSKVSLTGQGGTSGYAAAKGGMNSLTREWALDFAKFGVRVNAVIVAEAWTSMYESWLAGLSDPDKELKKITGRIPLGARMTTPEEIASTTVFLASIRSSHTSGELVFVDGGYTHLDRAYSPVADSES